MEIELKFQVPAARRAALLRAVATARVQRTALQAVYFDTPGQALARAGLALRLRKEGRVWVQTLKSRASVMERLEHEVHLPAQAGMPALDPQRHAGTPVGALLQAATQDAGALQPLYRIHVQRLHRLVRHAGATVEIAYDRGRLLADGREQAVDEIEFELKSGAPLALVALAQRWAARFGLWWDVRNKSEQGTRLALGLEQVPAVKAQAPGWARGSTPAQVWAAALQSALAQALPNAAELASGRGGPEHLHQLRVALRRLRAALRLLAPWSSQPDAALALETAWRGPFGTLGAARDADVLAQSLLPRLQQAGAPVFSWPAAPAGPAPGDCVRGPEFTDLLLRSLLLALQPPAAGEDLAAAARTLLRPAWRRILREAEAFSTADATARHRLRKRLKRLRYVLEFLLPQFPHKPAARMLRAIGKALAALGELNDLEMARQACQALTSQQPQAWFALGWLAAQQVVALQQAQQSLHALADAPRVWRGG
jgi:triphosphatase